VVSAQTSFTFGFPYQNREANARYIFTSDATSISVQAINDTLQNALLNTPGGFHALGLVVDGVNFGSGFQLGISIGNQATVRLSGWAAGTHTFEIVDGQRYIPGGVKHGTPAIYFEVPHGSSMSIASPTAPAKRIVVVGDSLSSGQVITTVGHAAPYDAWPMVMRANVLASGSGSWGGARVINDSLAGFEWRTWASDPLRRAALIAQCDGTVSNLLIIFLGVNDYSLNRAAATFSADIATVLDNFHADVPGASVAVCRIPEFNTTPNAAGLTPNGYNLLIDSAVSTRTAFAFTIDLSTTLTLVTDYASDNIHPNSTGMAKLEPAIRAALGY
jgi:lysophospholipase L1-like esterase